MKEVLIIEKIRDYRFDNLKCILIFLVVLGHLILKPDTFIYGRYLYKIIYTFHMPLFLFIFGYFSKYNKTILKNKIIRYIVLYFIFTIIYMIYNYFIIRYKPLEEFKLNILTPYWILWYLMVLIYYTLTIYILEYLKKYKYSKFIIISISFIICLLIGYVSYINDFLSLSRYFYFLPFFLLGYYTKEKDFKENKILKYTSVILVPIILFLLFGLNFNVKILYGRYAYIGGYGIKLRLLFLIIAIIWIIFIMENIFPKLNKNIPIMTNIGKNTIYIYLGHGFIVNLLDKLDIFKYIKNFHLLILSIIAILIILILGNKKFSKLILKINIKFENYIRTFFNKI